MGNKDLNKKKIRKLFDIAALPFRRLSYGEQRLVLLTRKAVAIAKVPALALSPALTVRWGSNTTA